MFIQEYVTKVFNLINKIELKNQTSKTLIFREFYFKNQDRVMLTNLMYIKDQLNSKRIKLYLKRIIILIRRDKVKRLIRKKNRITFISNY